MSHPVTQSHLTPSSLLEQSERKYDIGPFRVGPFKFIVNSQHPPIDRRTRIQTVFVVAGSVVAALALPPILQELLYQSPRSLSRFIAASGHLRLMIIPPLVFFLWWKLGGRRREDRLLKDLIGLQSFDEDESRIHVRGRPSELLEFSAIRDELFEPQVFYASHRMIGVSLIARTLLAMAGFAIAAFIIEKRGWQEWWLAAAIALPCLYLMVRGTPDTPTYYRFVPGRLDVLFFPWLLPAKPRVCNLDLRKVRLRIDLTSRKNMVAIEGFEEPIEFRRDNLPDPLGFALSLSRAALSTATPPHLPMDALTG